MSRRRGKKFVTSDVVVLVAVVVGAHRGRRPDEARLLRWWRRFPGSQMWPGLSTGQTKNVNCRLPDLMISRVFCPLYTRTTPCKSLDRSARELAVAHLGLVQPRRMATPGEPEFWDQESEMGSRARAKGRSAQKR